jgi:Ca2+/Na+ antiporter
MAIVFFLAGLAASFGISPLVIGLTVVAFGTSSPELAVSVKAAMTGQASIGLGNVVGSNIFNVLFILGISALIVPCQWTDNRPDYCSGWYLPARVGHLDNCVHGYRGAACYYGF